MLEATNLACVRGDRQLFEGLNFSVKPTELLHVKGMNGSGKTSLLRTLSGLSSPAEGRIVWKGQDVRNLSEEYHKDLIYLGHLNGIKAELTALENLRVAAALSGAVLPTDRVWAALARLGLSGYEDLPTKVLSQGQKRRVALARLLVSDSPLWILDEPFTALDISAVALLQSILEGHLARGGLVVLTTHQDFSLMSGTVRHLQLGVN